MIIVAAVALGTHTVLRHAEMHIDLSQHFKSLDVIAHELAHEVTDHTSGFEYHNQSGALNESMSDAVGAMVKQWSLQQTADEADWLIGSEVFTPGIDADALRSMKAPGKAYSNDQLGTDPQPDHMSKFVHLPDTDEGDNGDVHINSTVVLHPGAHSANQ